jgi:hypothetical protein
LTARSIESDGRGERGEGRGELYLESVQAGGVILHGEDVILYGEEISMAGE